MISARHLWVVVLLIVVGSSAALATARGGATLLSENYDVDYALITPDEQYVLFSASDASQLDRKIYRHDLGTGTNTPLSSPASDLDYIFYITPDSQYVFFTGPRIGSNTTIYRVPVAGGTQEVFATGGNGSVAPAFSGIKFTPDSQQAVYVFNQSIDDQMFSKPVAGGAAIDLTTGAPNGSLFDYTISPSGNYVLYRVQISDALAALMVVPTTGGTAVMLNPAGTDLDSGDYAFAESTNAIVFRAFDSGGANPTLYRANLDGSNRIVLSDPGNVGEFALSPDEEYALFTYRPDNVVTTSLERVRIADGASTTLIAPDGANYFDLVVSPTDNRVIYQRFSGGNRTTTSLVYEPVGSPVSLAPNSGPFPYIQVSEDGEYVVYLENTDGPLYSVPTDGSAPPELLSPAGDIDQWYIAPSQSQVYFSVEEGAVENLYTVPIAGGVPTPLYQRNGTDGRILVRGAFTTDDRLIFVDYDPADAVDDSLYLIAGLTPPTPTATPTVSPSATPTTGSSPTPTPTGSPTGQVLLYLPLIQKASD